MPRLTPGARQRRNTSRQTSDNDARRSQLTLVQQAYPGFKPPYRPTITWAYMWLVHQERKVRWFARMSDEQFSWAVNRAAAADVGHEHGYIVPEYESYTDARGQQRRRDRYYDDNREALLQFARENVLSWAA